MFRFRWDHIDAKLIDQRFLRRDSYNVHNSGSSYQVWEYIVEFRDADGQTVRLPVKEKTFKVDLPEIGGTVPVLVNRRRTKAAFNLKDPRIDAVGRLKRKQAARRARDEARFEEKLGKKRKS
jgi:hypothetical protein